MEPSNSGASDVVDSAPSPRQIDALSATQALTSQHICDSCYEKFESTSALAMHHMKPHMANIGQEQPSIRNMQVVSSNRVHSTQ